MFNLLHVTSHVHSILQTGIDPGCDRRGKGRVWFCERKTLDWTLHHLRQVNGNYHALGIIQVDTRGLNIRQHRDGIYWTDEHVESWRVSVYVAS